MTNTNENTKSTGEKFTNSSANKPAGKKRRRWLRVLLILLLLLIVIAWLSPYLASTETGLKLLVNLLNKYSDQRVQIDNLSLTWLGPCRLGNIEIWDDHDRLILQLDQFTWTRGLWQALFSRDNFDQITLEAPRLQVYLFDEGQEKDEAEIPRQIIIPAEISALRGKIILQNGNLQLARSDGRSYSLTDIEGRLELDSLNEIKGTASLKANGSDGISAEFDLKSITAQQQINLDNASGSFSLNTDNQLDTGPLLEFFQEQTTAGGIARFSTQAEMQNGLIKAELTCSVQDLYAKRTGIGDTQPINIDLDCRIQADKNQIAAQSRLRSKAGDLQAKFSQRRSDTQYDITLDEIVSAILTGAEITLPDFTLESDGQLDLPTLAAAVPALLQIRPDLTITDGQLRIDKFALQGGKTPRADLTVRLNNLTALKDQQNIICDPIYGNFNLLLEPDVGLRIEHAELNSAFAQLNAQGTSANLKTVFIADLDKLHRQIMNFLEVDNFTLAGAVNGTVDINRAENEQVNINLALTGNRLHYQSGERPFNADKLQLNYRGCLDLRDKKLEKIVATSADCNLDNQLVARVSGSYDLPGKTFTSQIDLQQAELAFLLPRESPPAYAGRLSWSGACNSDQGLITLQGKGALTDFQVKSEKSSFYEPRLEFAHLTIMDTPRESITLKNTRINSRMFSSEFAGTIEKYHSLCQLNINGSYKGSWEKITALLHEISPDTTETIAFTGTTGGDFYVRGPARQADIKSAYRDLDAALEVSWNTGNIYGLELGETILSPSMTGGQVIFADANIPASGGSMLLDGLMFDLRRPDPAVRIPQKLQVLKNVQINADFAHQMLSRVNPIFNNLAGMEGIITLQLEQVDLPVSARIKQIGAGRGHLDLSRMKIQPQGLLAELMRLGGLDIRKSQSVRVHSLDFAIQNGRITYDNFLILFEDKFDLKFSGSVGFDDTLDMVVSIPLRVALLEKFGIRGPTREYVRLLADTRIDIPLIGTRAQPRLDFAQVDIKPIIDKATQAIIREQTSGVLDKILKPNQPPAEPENQEKPKPQTEPKPVERQIFDILIDILEEQAKNRK